MLGEVSSRYGWECLAYCLMTNHVHLLVRTRDATLGVGVQQLHGRYAQEFNKRHERPGHLFQGRYGSTRVETESQFHAVTAYIARNPVEAGLCAHPDDWRWSDCEPAFRACEGSDPGSDP